MTVRLASTALGVNEEVVLLETNRRLLGLLTRLHDMQLILAHCDVRYLDDRTGDDTWALSESRATSYARTHGIKHSCYRGRQAVLLTRRLILAGAELVGIDVGLQNETSVTGSMVPGSIGGGEVAYGVRDSQQADRTFKRKIAPPHFRLMPRNDIYSVRTHAHFRSIRCRSVESLRLCRMNGIFVRNVAPLFGCRRYGRAERSFDSQEYALRIPSGPRHCSFSHFLMG